MLIVSLTEPSILKSTARAADSNEMAMLTLCCHFLNESRTLMCERCFIWYSSTRLPALVLDSAARSSDAATANSSANSALYLSQTRKASQSFRLRMRLTTFRMSVIRDVTSPSSSAARCTNTTHARQAEESARKAMCLTTLPISDAFRLRSCAANAVPWIHCAQACSAALSWRLEARRSVLVTNCTRWARWLSSAKLARWDTTHARMPAESRRDLKRATTLTISFT
mmetsp:Transcript_91476/g.261279  ORF Transcript_91476/g.261279 Transcript_91476/m.261279 type:complete len:226 (-) Transcript_91476:2820-3497(-)